MKFAEVIRNAGLNPLDFPKASNITIELYDGKERLSVEETVNYAEPLFTKNEGSFLNFQSFVSGLELDPIESMKVKIDADSVILFYRTPRSIVFLRYTPMDPLDYME